MAVPPNLVLEDKCHRLREELCEEQVKLIAEHEQINDYQYPEFHGVSSFSVSEVIGASVSKPMHVYSGMSVYR